MHNLHVAAKAQHYAVVKVVCPTGEKGFWIDVVGL